MKITSNRFINIIDDESAGLIQTIGDVTNVDNTVYDIIENYFDSFGNFLFQNKVKGTEYPFQYNTDSEFYDRLKNQVNQNGLNDNGSYTINYHFVNDIFDSIQNNKNRFIVTEISSDRTEVRLNPLSSESSFIDKFNKFKDYKKQKIIFSNVQDPITILQGFINNSVRTYINNFFIDSNINFIVSNITILHGGKNIQLRAYLGIYYDVDRLDNLINSIKKLILDTKETIIQEFLTNILSNNNRLNELKAEFISNTTEQNLEKIERVVFDLIEINLVNQVIENINLELDEDFVEPPDDDDGDGDGGGGETIFGCTDPDAENYNSEATDNDGSCIYETTVTQYPPFGRPGSYDGEFKWNGETNKGYIWDSNRKIWVEQDDRKPAER